MPCYHPIKGFLSRELTNNGKRRIVFNNALGYDDLSISVPCGQCIGCRLERSKKWAIRCVHESSLYDNNCFITLTFNDDNLPVGGSLVKRDWVLFMKRLRKKFGAKIRFFHCGEYGELLSRPHHHACIFNFDFPDKKLWKVKNNVRLYRSEILEKLWTYGFCTIGDVTFESAAYVARYVVKKINGVMAESHYNGRLPEYISMSRRPGIGKGWFDLYKDDIYKNGELIIRGGIKVNPPRYYDNLFDLTCEENRVKLLKIKRLRADKQKSNPDNLWRRLQVRETVQLKNLELLKRGVENGSESV